MKPKENLELYLSAHCALADIIQKATWNSQVVCVYTHMYTWMKYVCFLFSSDYSAFPIWFVLILETEWLLFESYQQSSSSNFNVYAILLL